jgi:hypothetical protein
MTSECKLVFILLITGFLFFRNSLHILNKLSEINKFVQLVSNICHAYLQVVSGIKKSLTFSFVTRDKPF